MLEKTCLGMLILGSDLHDTLSSIDEKIVKNKVKSPVIFNYNSLSTIFNYLIYGESNIQI